MKEIYFKAHVEETLEVSRKELEEGELPLTFLHFVHIKHFKQNAGQKVERYVF